MFGLRLQLGMMGFGRFRDAYRSMDIRVSDGEIEGDWRELLTKGYLQLGGLSLQREGRRVTVTYNSDSQRGLAFLYTAFQCDMFEDVEFYDEAETDIALMEEREMIGETRARTGLRAGWRY